MNGDSVHLPSERLDDRLQTLKQFGCNVLVTGNVRESVSQQMTRKLLGAPDEPRTRLLGLTDQDRADAPDLLPGEVAPSDERVTVADYGRTRSIADSGETRSAFAASGVGTRAQCEQADLDELRAGLCDAITTAKIARSGFDPAELRVSVFTLSYLLNRHEPAAVDRFVSTVGDHVRGVRGMAHFHLPVADDSTPVQRLASLFDLRAELREKRGRPEQRWHLPESDETTAWFGL